MQANGCGKYRSTLIIVEINKGEAMRFWIMVMDQMGFSYFDYLGEFDVMNDDDEVMDKANEQLSEAVKEKNGDLPFGEMAVAVSRIEMENMKEQIEKQLRR